MLTQIVEGITDLSRLKFKANSNQLQEMCKERHQKITKHKYTRKIKSLQNI